MYGNLRIDPRWGVGQRDATGNRQGAYACDEAARPAQTHHASLRNGKRDCWGLTAGDSYQGYVAHCPQEDLGVIQPTAALSSFPYTPEYSLQALKHFYYTLGDRIWGDYGFADGFSETKDWYATSHLAIDQGPVVVMIENYRTGLIWKLFMRIPEVQAGLKRLGFTSPWILNGK
jgi:hypothetical protein